jgi:hypothetical protein
VAVDFFGRDRAVELVGVVLLGRIKIGGWVGLLGARDAAVAAPKPNPFRIARRLRKTGSGVAKRSGISHERRLYTETIGLLLGGNIGCE